MTPTGDLHATLRDQQAANDEHQAINDEHQAANNETALAHITDRQYHRMRWEARVAYILMAVFLAGAIFMFERERQARLESVAALAATVTLERCTAANRVGVVLTDAFKAQRRLAVARYARKQLDADQLAVSLKALDSAIAGLAPQPCSEQAEALKKAAQK